MTKDLVFHVAELVKSEQNVYDVTLAEFIIDLGKKSADINSFGRNLRSLDANFSNEFIDRLYNSITNRQVVDRPSSKVVKSQIRETWPVLNKVYSGLVTKITDFGCFVKLYELSRPLDGLLHISKIVKHARLDHPSDYLHEGQHVFVKVIKANAIEKKIGLTLIDVDQTSGVDLAIENISSLKTPRKRLASPDLWEIKQLVASGALPKTALIDNQANLSFDNAAKDIELSDDEIEIEVKEENLPSNAFSDANQIKIIRAPDGSLNRSAISGANLAKERMNDKAKLSQKSNQKEIEDKLLTNHVSMDSDDDHIVVVSNHRKAGESYGLHTNLTIKEQRESLPVYKLRSDFINIVRENKIIVVVGETGSGKTTQLTQYLHEEGYTKQGLIGCTQPRRVAAISVAKRVCEEINCKLGQEVGYTIRFDDCTSSQTKIKYLTDGMLQRECLINKDLRNYSVIILDEAHERTIATDVLFGFMKEISRRREDFRVIVTSATLDCVKFSEYFDNCPIFTIPGRSYPVEVFYTKEPEPDYLDAALVTVMQIHLVEPPGDILVFLTGQEEIDSSCEILADRMKSLGRSVPELIILPVYSALPSEIQSRIFEPAKDGARKVIIATNIAETSLTIDGIVYVVDPGFVKQNCFDPKSGLDSLVVVPISQAQARQRAGRAGRVGPGKCYRLYTEDAYNNEMRTSSLPEIQRQNLTHTVLLLKAMGINDILNFDFMDPPPKNMLANAIEILVSLSALDEKGYITELGRQISEFPMEPPMARVLIASIELGCIQEVMTIIGMLSAQNIWFRPREKQNVADRKRSKFQHGSSDHLSLLKVYNEWRENQMSEAWCYENFIQIRAMRRAGDVRKQLAALMERHHHPLKSCGSNVDNILKSFCYGFFRNVAKRDVHEGNYITVAEGTSVYLHPSSSLFGKNHQWVLYQELIFTSKEYMHSVSAIKPQWLVQCAPNFYKQVDQSKAKNTKQIKLQPLFSRNEADKKHRRINKK